jgi:hypothetical protein
MFRFDPKFKANNKPHLLLFSPVKFGKILNLTPADQNALSCTSAIVFLFGDDGWRHRRLLFLLIRQPAI